MHQPNEFQQIGQCTAELLMIQQIFPARFMRDGADFYCHFLTYEQNHIKFGENMDESSALHGLF